MASGVGTGVNVTAWRDNMVRTWWTMVLVFRPRSRRIDGGGAAKGSSPDFQSHEDMKIDEVIGPNVAT